MTGTLPAAACAPWCEWRDGHADVRDREDQTCWSPSQRVDLSLYPPIEDSVYDRDTRRWAPGPDHVDLYAGRNVDDSAAHLRIVHETDGPVTDLQLTLSEAAHLVEAVQLLLAQIGAATTTA